MFAERLLLTYIFVINVRKKILFWCQNVNFAKQKKKNPNLSKVDYFDPVDYFWNDIIKNTNITVDTVDNKVNLGSFGERTGSIVRITFRVVIIHQNRKGT